MTACSPKVEVLISCMFQNGREIIQRSNIQSDVLVISAMKTQSKVFNSLIIMAKYVRRV